MAFSRSRKLANIGKAIDSSATNDFLGLDDSGGLFKDVAYSNVLGSPTILDSSALTSLVDSAYVQARQTDVGIDSAAIINLVDSSYVSGKVPPGSLGIDSAATINLIDSSYVSGKITAGLDSAGVTGIVDSDYVSSKTGASSGFSYYCYTATAGQTDFTGADKFNNTLSYSSSADNILVFYNGVLQIKTFDYTTSGGDTVTLTTGADSGVPVTIAEFAVSTGGSSAAANQGTRAIMFNASSGSSTNHGNKIEYYNISSTGNALDFGDLSATTANNGGGDRAVSNGTRAVGCNWFTTSTVWDLEYVTIASTGNATDFGNLSNSISYQMGFSDGTKGYFSSSGNNYTDDFDIEVITIATAANATSSGYDLQNKRHGGTAANLSRGLWAGGSTGSTYESDIEYTDFPLQASTSDFGNLTVVGQAPNGCNNATRAVFCSRWNGDSNLGGGNYAAINVMDYVTIATTGNASDFGDMVVAATDRGSASSWTDDRGTWANGYTGNANGRTNAIDYVTISTTGNASDFGDMTAPGNQVYGTSGAA